MMSFSRPQGVDAGALVAAFGRLSDQHGGIAADDFDDHFYKARLNQVRAASSRHSPTTAQRSCPGHKYALAHAISTSEHKPPVR